MALLKYGFTAKVSTQSIGAVLHQPNSFYFPLCEFGRPPHVTKSSLQSSWFAKQTGFIITKKKMQVIAFILSRLSNKTNHMQFQIWKALTYISTGYKNWKEATTIFPMHESSRCHKDAMLKLVTLPATSHDIGETLSQQQRGEKQSNRQCFLKILSNCKLFYLDKDYRFVTTGIPAY